MKNSGVLVVIGKRGSGKTTFAQKLVKATGRNALVYDVQRQWGQTAPEMENFLKNATSIRGSAIVFEEAGIFFGPHGRSEDMLRLLVSARHTQNIVVLIFHAIRQVPPYVFELADAVALAETGDTLPNISRRLGNGHRMVKAMKALEALPPYTFLRVEL